VSQQRAILEQLRLTVVINKGGRGPGFYEKSVKLWRAGVLMSSPQV